MAPSKPLSFEGARSDIDALKARNVDLSGLLPPLADTTSPGDDSLERSYDFVASARAALRAAGTGEVYDAVSILCFNPSWDEC